MKVYSNIPFPDTQKYNDYQTVSYINQTSFLNEDDELIYEADMVITGDLPNVITETRTHMKYALLSYSDYVKLNNVISLLKGRKLGEATARVWGMSPSLAKVNIEIDEETEVESYELKCVMQIEANEQDMFPELMPELFDSYIKADETLSELTVEGATNEQVDWILNHYSAVGNDIDLIQLDIEPRSELSDGAVKSLIGKGTTVITIDNGYTGKDKEPKKDKKIKVKKGKKVKITKNSKVIFDGKAKENWLIETNQIVE